MGHDSFILKFVLILILTTRPMSVLQLQRVAVCCSVFQYVAVCVYTMAHTRATTDERVAVERVAVCCSVLQCVAVYMYTVAHTRDTTDEHVAVAACCSVPAACCSVL